MFINFPSSFIWKRHNIPHASFHPWFRAAAFSLLILFWSSCQDATCRLSTEIGRHFYTTEVKGSTAMMLVHILSAFTILTLVHVHLFYLHRMTWMNMQQNFIGTLHSNDWHSICYICQIFQCVSITNFW